MFTRTSRAKRRIGAAVLAALVGSLLAFASPGGALGTTKAATDRLSGANRYATAADIAQQAQWGTAADQPITVVNGENFPDGLAAAALGNRVLLVRQNSIPAETSAAIAAIEAAGTGKDGVGAITVVGGTGVVSSSVLEQLDALNGAGAADGVTRIAGADRYETAIAVAKAVIPTPTTHNVVLATGENFPDALAAGPFAIKNSASIVLNSGSALRADVKAYISTLTTGKVWIIGGTGAVPASVEAEIQAMGKNVARIAGATREETAVAVANAMAANEHSAVLVNRNGFADALAAGPFAAHAKVDGAIMLVNTDSIPAATAGWHDAKCLVLGAATGGGDAGKIYAVGGTGVISDAVVAGAATASLCPAVTYTAALANSGITQRTLTVAQANGAAANVGPTLVAVAGSAADGAYGNAWTIKIEDQADNLPPTAVITGTAAAPILTFNVSIPTTGGMTQADFAAAWNSTQASALFTMAANATVVAPPNLIHDTSNGKNVFTVATAAAGKVTQTVTLTFNQDVDDLAGKVPVAADFQLNSSGVIVATPSTQAPLANTVGGTSTLTFVIANQIDATKVLAVGSGGVMANAKLDGTGAATIASVKTNLSPANTLVPFTAG